MCGIYFSLSKTEPHRPSENSTKLLRNRGPDNFNTHVFRAENDDFFLSFSSSVLSLRGTGTTEQPLVNATNGSVLCWNGEAWTIDEQKVKGNDASIIFRLLLDALDPEKGVSPVNHPHGIAGQISEDDARQQTLHSICRVIESISGPYAFVFYDAIYQRIIFGRDCLGRRSLLTAKTENGAYVISSVADTSIKNALTQTWQEVNSAALQALDLRKPGTFEGQDAGTQILGSYRCRPIEWVFRSRDSFLIDANWPTLNRPYVHTDSLSPQSASRESPHLKNTVRDLEGILHESIKLRVQDVPSHSREHSSDTRVAVLFSGGIDCTVIAGIASGYATGAIDLINVAFENPRVAAASTERRGTESKQDSVYELCPDRITARKSYAELQAAFPYATWQLVNIPYQEYQAHCSDIKALMYPHRTEMDLSIAAALYFAARGSGQVSHLDQSKSSIYKSPARVLLSGLGADELFAGYTRHAIAFSRRGLEGLAQELDLDFGRLGQRNLGRDDRVTAHWGREVRYPFLDEQLLSWALACPVSERSGFGGSEDGELLLASNNGDEIDIQMEPGKRCLRLLAIKMGLPSVAQEKKRAIQFGSRSAKMEKGRTKGTQMVE
ncbi:MAG: hypothetical protein M1825_003036 [Sarcosagium campestre]|nr:MAG: hypothetical protein M1825_003036 [Sarcosagium campestre]